MLDIITLSDYHKPETFCCINSLLTHSFNQIILCMWLYLRIQIPLQLMSHVLDWIQIRRFCWSYPPIDMLTCIERPCQQRSMFGFLHESITCRILLCYKCQQCDLQNIHKKGSIHDTIKDFVGPRTLMPAHTCTLMGCLGLYTMNTL